MSSFVSKSLSCVSLSCVSLWCVSKSPIAAATRD